MTPSEPQITVTAGLSPIFYIPSASRFAKFNPRFKTAIFRGPIWNGFQDAIRYDEEVCLALNMGMCFTLNGFGLKEGVFAYGKEATVN